MLRVHSIHLHTIYCQKRDFKIHILYSRLFGAKLVQGKVTESTQNSTYSLPHSFTVLWIDFFAVYLGNQSAPVTITYDNYIIQSKTWKQAHLPKTNSNLLSWTELIYMKQSAKKCENSSPLNPLIKTRSIVFVFA